MKVSVLQYCYSFGPSLTIHVSHCCYAHCCALKEQSMTTDFNILYALLLFYPLTIFLLNQEKTGLFNVLDAAGRIVFALPCHLCYRSGKATGSSRQYFSEWLFLCFSEPLFIDTEF